MSSEHEHHDHPPHLAHHFETPEQQFESGKLGMWVFLATEILMFGGLFCAYAIYRGNHQDVFLFGYGALDKMWGATNTVVLLASSLTMAWGVRAAQKGQQKLLMAMLVATFMGGVGFMCIKTVEYQSKWDHHLFPGAMNAFYYEGGSPKYPEDMAHAIEYINAKNMGGHAEEGHGAHGKDSHASDSHGEDSHGEVVHAEAPAHEAEAHSAEEHADDSHAVVPAAFGPPIDVSVVQPPASPSDMGVLGSAIDAAGVDEVPSAAHTKVLWEDLSTDEQKKVHLFFGIYFMMTGLHGLHVLIGMGVIFGLMYMAGGTKAKAVMVPFLLVMLGLYALFYGIVLAGPTWMNILGGALVLLAVLWAAVALHKAKSKENSPGAFGKDYFTPVDIGGLYWHLVDLIWIFLFPLLYLIH